MTLLELVRRTRTALNDFGGDADVDWRVDDSLCETSNADLVAFLSAAAEEYCRRRPVRDASADLCTVTLSGGGDGRVSLDPRILRVRRVKTAGVTHALEKRDLVWLDAYRPGWEDEAGDPQLYIDDEGAGELRVVPVPPADVVLTLTVERLPLAGMETLADSEEIPDIPAEDQDSLKYWAAKLVYEERKEEVEDPKRAAAFEALFERYVGPRPDPMAMRRRRWLSDRKARTRGYFR